MNKDSLEMTDADRVLILGMVRGILKEDAPIVITHGTDTMVETELYLSAHVRSSLYSRGRLLDKGHGFRVSEVKQHSVRI